MFAHKAADVIEIVMKKKTPTGKADHSKNTTNQKKKMINLPTKEEEKKRFFEIIKNNPFVQYAPIFSPRKRGDERKGGLEIERKNNPENPEKRWEIKINIWRELDISDQELFLTLLTMGKKQNLKHIEQANEKLKEMKLSLTGKIALNKEKKLTVTVADGTKKEVTRPATFDLKDIPAIEIIATRHEILQELKKGTGSNQYKWLDESLERLAGVSIYFNTKLGGGQFNLLSRKHYNLNNDRKYHIYINPLSTLSLIGQQSKYISINLTNRQQLKSETAKAIHYYISGIIRKGEQKHINVDTIMQNVYPEYKVSRTKLLKELTPKIIEKRREYIRKGLYEITNTIEEWNISIQGRGAKSYAIIARDIPIKNNVDQPIF